MGKFNRWSIKGGVLKGIYQEQQGEAIINIRGNDFKVEDVMLKDIHRDSVILLPINSMSFCEDDKIKISMGRNVISSEEMMMLQEARDKKFIEEFHNTYVYTED